MTEELLQAVYLLATVDPHVDEDARFRTDREAALYHRGYWRALVAALQSMELALRRRALWVRERRRAAVRASADRVAASALAGAARGEEIRPVCDHVGDHVAQRGGQMEWHFETVITLREFIATRSDEQLASLVNAHDPLGAYEDWRMGHPVQASAGAPPAQLQIPIDAISRGVEEGPLRNDPQRAGVVADRSDVSERSTAVEKHKSKRARRFPRG